MNQNKPSDMEKVEVEFEFYGFTLDELKKEYEKLFRLHCKKLTEKFTNAVIDAAQRNLTVEIANRIKSMSSNAMNLIKPETVKLLTKINGQIDKHFTIPANVPIGESSLQNTPDMDDFERSCQKEIARMELIYKQQAIMMNHFKKEMELYDNLIEEANVDMAMCDIFENNFTESNFNAEIIDNVIDTLKSIGIDANEN